jgi:hypothetical protein
MESKIYYITHNGSSIALLTITLAEPFKEVILITLQSHYFLNSNPERIEVSSRNQYYATYPIGIGNDTIVRAMIIRTISGYNDYNPLEFNWIEL